MEKEPPENDDERYVREMNETAERDARIESRQRPNCGGAFPQP